MVPWYVSNGTAVRKWGTYHGTYLVQHYLKNKKRLEIQAHECHGETSVRCTMVPVGTRVLVHVYVPWYTYTCTNIHYLQNDLKYKHSEDITVYVYHWYSHMYMVPGTVPTQK
jgi:hypothetical protein